MRINKIKLYNFGSYEGQNNFDFSTNNPEERVVVIGGKNGAGKTTLFTAIQVCLYGNYTFGYKTAGKLYLKEIYNLVNSKVRLDENAKAYIEITFSHIDNSEMIEYVIRREWCWPKNELKETLVVYKNENLLEDEELSNFQNYLLHLIPPDMLKLYFFDGEKIADYFMSSSEVNIHDALMILSGNDTFDILYENVMRVLKISENVQVSAAREYLEEKQSTEMVVAKCQSLENQIENNTKETEDLQMSVEEHKQAYADNGGITLDEWKGLQNQLKEEEEKRERLNWNNKVAATDMLPFLMIPDLVSRVIPQIDKENEFATYKALKDSLESEAFNRVLKAAMNQTSSKNPMDDSFIILDNIRAYLLNEKWNGFETLFDLSKDEEAAVQAGISRITSFNKNIFKQNRSRINKSIERSKEIRNRLQNSNIENFQDYIQGLSALEEKIAVLKAKKEFLEESLEQSKQELVAREVKLNSLKKAFEEQLKKQSVSAVSGRVLLLLEELQKYLHESIIKQVENDLNEKFEQLIRKKDFFSRITVEKDFSVHILRNQAVAKSDLLSLLRGSGLSLAIGALGKDAIEELQDIFGVNTAPELRRKLKESEKKKYVLPVEIEKNRLSSGEKQIFVMALYWAMMNQSKNDLPFIIDTPFARIDTEHRSNITNQFFTKLSGQLMILSTDEELSGTHLKDMKEQISHVYMLEYGDDKATHIQSNKYFEV